MSETTTSAPKAPKSKAKITAVIALILTLLVGANHYTFRIGYTDVTVGANDSTLSVTVKPEVPGPVAPVDTTKKDTTKKN